MENKIFIGCDNGITGSIGIIGREEPLMYKTPTVTQQSYTKTKQNISRVDIPKFKSILLNCFHYPTLAILERPLVNPGMFKATMSAIRCLEAQLCILEALDIPYMYIDSKQWQRELLPHVPLIKKEGETKKEKSKRVTANKNSLKKLSLDIGKRLFPSLSEIIDEQGDADGILIAEWARRNNL